MTTTPFRVVRVAAKETTTKPTTKNRQQNSRNGAGPSKPSSRTKRKRSPTSQPEQEENDENDEEEEQEIIKVPKPLRSARVGPSRGGKAASLNQRQTKAKTKPASTTKRGKANAVGNGARTDDTMDVDEVRIVPTEPESGQEEDDDEGEEETDNHASGVRSRAAAHTTGTRGVDQNHKTAKNRRDVEDSRAEMGRSQREERMQRQIDQLKKQVEQVSPPFFTRPQDSLKY